MYKMGAGLRFSPLLGKEKQRVFRQWLQKASYVPDRIACRIFMLPCDVQAPWKFKWLTSNGISGSTLRSVRNDGF